MPAAGYELRDAARRGHLALEPAEGGARGRSGRARRSAPRAGSSSATAPTPCWAAAATSPGRSGSPRSRRRIPVVLTEADSHLGLTNRLLAPRARRVCLAFPIAGRDGDRYLVTGRPVPPTVDDRAAARAEFGIPPEATCVLIFGGSLGARSINLAAVEAFADAGYHVLHVPGARDFAELRAPGEHYHLREYVVAVRAGAGRRRPRGRPRRRLGVRARPVRPAGDPDPVSARLRRPPDRQRALDGGGRRRDDPRRRRADARSGCAREVDALLGDPGAAGRDGRRVAPPGAPGRRRGGRRERGARRRRAP